MELDKVKRQIRNLLALANNNPSAEEAASAAAQAQRLMEKYRIESIAYTKEGADVEQITSHDPLYTSGRVALWRQHLAKALADANYCTIYMSYSGSRQNSIMLVGRKSDADAVRYLFLYCSNQIEKLCKKYLSDKHLSKSKGRVAGNNFKLGAAKTVADRLEKATSLARKNAEKEFDRKKIEGKSTAIVKFSDAVTQLQKRKEELADWMGENLTLKKGPKVNYYADADAYGAGQKAGKKIELDKNKRALNDG